MNKVLLGTLLALTAITVSMMTSHAFAQYMGSVSDSGKTGKNTLEETLKLAKERVDSAKANPSLGSGTPYLAAGGVLGASAISAAVFGGIAAAFYIKGRSGRYAAQGRG
jgi:hypothetical protein